SHSLNAAQSKLKRRQIAVDFARLTTGDGFYVWNRDLGLEANVHLYELMCLVLADNAIAHSKARNPIVPSLRAGFHVGSSYEFHQAEGLTPTLFHYIVGHVTVELKRMIDSARPHQILVGDFRVSSGKGTTELATPEFVELASTALAGLQGLELSGERI